MLSRGQLTAVGDWQNVFQIGKVKEYCLVLSVPLRVNI